MFDEQVQPALQVDGLSISFGSIHANQDVSFSVGHGEVHALLGENGAGKSTLVKMLYGVYHPDSGFVDIEGKRVSIASPSDARAHGIGLVFQDMRLIPAMKVWENIALFLSDTPIILKRSALVEKIRSTSEQWGLSVDPFATVNELSIGQWQRVELLKVLMQGADILILDEPTSVLTPDEVDSLFGVVRRLQAAGTAVILITHKMREVREIADKVTILRKGAVSMRDRDVATISDDELVEAMVGHAVSPIDHKCLADYHAQPILELAKINKKRVDGTVGLADVSLRIYPREVLGIAGISGNGQNELADILAGYLSPDSGDLVLDGHGEIGGKRGGFTRQGVVAIAADPIRQTVIPGMDIASHAALWENSGISNHNYDIRSAGTRLVEHAKAIGLQIPVPSRIMSELSGGNIQRVILASLIYAASQCIVASYPTRGLDVATAADTRKALLDVRRRGCAVVLISEDIDEIIEMSDRVMVLADGHNAGLLSGSKVTKSNIATLMTKESTATGGLL